MANKYRQARVTVSAQSHQDPGGKLPGGSEGRNSITNRGPSPTTKKTIIQRGLDIDGHFDVFSDQKRLRGLPDVTIQFYSLHTYEHSVRCKEPLKILPDSRAPSEPGSRDFSDTDFFDPTPITSGARLSTYDLSWWLASNRSNQYVAITCSRRPLLHCVGFCDAPDAHGFPHQPDVTPTSSASFGQCRGCGRRLPLRISTHMPM
jgi:hypothetical protein